MYARWSNMCIELPALFDRLPRLGGHAYIS